METTGISFSSTAPRISWDEWKQEQGLVSREERERQDRAFRGFTAPCVKPKTPTKDEMSAAKRSLFETLQEEEKNSPYMDAFLQVESLDPQKTAERIRRYRLQMNQLSGADKATPGFRLIHVKFSHFILYWDRRLWYPGSAMLSICWNICHQMLQICEGQMPRVLLVDTCLAGSASDDFDRKLSNRIWRMLRHVLPVNIDGVHFAMQSTALTLALPFMWHAMGPEIRQNRFRLHSSFQALENLHGISMKRLKLPPEPSVAVARPMLSSAGVPIAATEPREVSPHKGARAA